jgi:DNA-directed RNA polymerase specialized sigma24 family protein
VPLDPDTAMGGNQHRFPTTRASLVGAAAGGGAPARAALEEIISVYWKPAYKHVRIQWRRPNEESKDLVQGFFTTLITGELLVKFDPAKGRLRNYLRGCLDHYVRKQDESASRLKRGGGADLTFDFDAAERELAGTAPSVEDVFLREWQREMFALALEDLRGICSATGKQLQFRLFEEYDLADDGRPGYAELAAAHGVPITTVTNHLAWARRELKRLMLGRSERL